MAALMVATHHAALCCNWIVSGNWGETGPTILELFAPAGAIIFFMLTGYLFWSKARARNGKIGALKLWRGRLYRIAPLYFFSLLFVLLVAAIQTGGHWLAWENWRPLSRLAALGALSWHSIGPVNLGEYNAGVVWTLIIVTAMATTLLCAATYRWIEFPFLSTAIKKLEQIDSEQIRFPREFV